MNSHNFKISCSISSTIPFFYNSKLSIISFTVSKIGRIEEECNCNAPMYRVCDEEGNVLLRIEGPFCMSECWSDMIFQVKSADKTFKVGLITRQWPGFFKEFYTNVGMLFNWKALFEEHYILPSLIWNFLNNCFYIWLRFINFTSRDSL